MIPPREVTNAVLALLRDATSKPVGDARRPDGPPTMYAILTPGVIPESDGGDLDDANRHLTYTCRLRTVAGNGTAPEKGDRSREQCEGLAHTLREALLYSSIAGAGWRVASVTRTASSGIDVEGPVANNVDDFSLWVVPGPASP